MVSTPYGWSVTFEEGVRRVRVRKKRSQIRKGFGYLGRVWSRRCKQICVWQEWMLGEQIDHCCDQIGRKVD